MAPQPNSQSVCVYSRERTRARATFQANGLALLQLLPLPPRNHTVTPRKTSCSKATTMKREQTSELSFNDDALRPLEALWDRIRYEGNELPNKRKHVTSWLVLKTQLWVRSSKRGKTKTTAQEFCVCICCRVFFKRPSGRRWRRGRGLSTGRGCKLMQPSPRKTN